MGATVNARQTLRLAALNRLVVAALLALAFVIAAPAHRAAAQTPDEQIIITEIRIEGAERIDPNTVYSYLTVRAGDPFDPAELNASLTSLFRTGLFADVVLRRDGSILVVSIVENPIINRIAFEGNDRLDNDTLEAEISSRPRVVYTRTRVQSDVARLLEIYRRSGRFAATVDPKVIQLDQNRVDLVFEIDEGPLTGISRITFIGNEAFSDSTLRDEILTEESGLFSFLSSDDTYDPDRVAFDRELLRSFYLSEGYADFRVISAVAELTPDREDFFVTFTIEEGERYRFGQIDIVSSLRDLNFDPLFDVVITEEGDVYNADQIENSIDLLAAEVSDQQFAFVDIRPQVTRNRDELLIDVTYEISEGPRVFVERIEIIGNVRTVDSVIRREMELVEGDPFSESLLRRSEARIRNLAFFRDVDVSTVPGSSPDRAVVRVEVEEQSTGELTLGAGFSTEDGPIGDLTLSERNLLGRGQELRVGASISGSSSEVDVSFTEPYFLGRNLSAGFDVFRTIDENDDDTAFEEGRLGGALRFGYPITRNLFQVWTYSLERREISDVLPSASAFIRDEEGVTVRSTVSQALTYRDLDSRIRPTDGFVVSLANDFTGLGGDVRLVRTTLSGSYFVPVVEDVILSVSAETGIVFGLGEDVRISDRFFVGGGSLRGFETGGIGPRDGNGDALGGRQFATGSVEVEFPVGLPEEFGITGRAFSDIGILREPQEETLNTGNAADVVLSTGSPRASVGAGLSWDSPFGPVRLDFAFPVIQEDFDEEERFRFSFGTSF